MSDEEKTEPVVTDSPAVTNEETNNWLSSELREQSNLGDFKTADDLAKSYVELQRMVGNSVRIPAEDASSEALKSFRDKIKDVKGIILEDDKDLYSKLGRPETAEDYKLDTKVPSEYFDAIPGLSDDITAFAKVAHESGLNTAQTEAMINMRLAEVKTQIDQETAQIEQSEVDLKKLWGTEYGARLESAQKVAKIYQEKYGDSVSDLINSPAGNNPAFLSMLNDLAGMHKEQGHQGMSGAQFGITPEIAKNKIAEKKSDEGFLKAYQDDMHPGHSRAVAEIAKLYNIAYNT